MKRDWLWLALILVGAVAFRLILMTKAYAVGFDEVNYLKLAASGHLHGLNHVLHTYWSPFYPLVVALFSYLMPDYEVAGKWASLLSSCAVIVPLFFFIRKFYDRRIALGTSLLVAFFTYAASFSVYAHTEFIYSFVAIAGIIAGWYALLNKNIVLSLVSGISFSLAYLTRPEGFGFLLTFLGVTFVVFLVALLKRKRVLPYVYIGLVSSIGFFAVALPYLMYLHRETGQWTLSTKGAANQQGEIYVQNMDQFAEDPHNCLSKDNKVLLQDDIYHLGTFLTAIKNDDRANIEISRSAFLAKVFENYYKILTEDLTKVLTVPLLILLGIGLFVDPWTRQRALINLYLLSYLVFFWLVLIPAFHITLRYFVPLIPLSFIWVAAGTNKVIDWLSETLKTTLGETNKMFSSGWVSAALIVVVIFASAILPEFGKHMKKTVDSTDEWAPCIEQKKAGLWLKEHGVNPPVIMAKNHAVSFYAGNYEIKESVSIPYNTIDRVLEYAKFRGVSYLVFNDRYRNYYPTLGYLLDQENIPPQLKLVYLDKENNGLRTLIYQIVTDESGKENL